MDLRFAFSKRERREMERVERSLSISNKDCVRLVFKHSAPITREEAITKIKTGLQAMRTGIGLELKEQFKSRGAETIQELYNAYVNGTKYDWSMDAEGTPFPF